MKKTTKKQIDEIFLNENGQIITEQKKVADTFNRFFTNVADSLLKDMGNSTTKFQEYLKNVNEQTIFLKEVDFGEVRDILKNLDITKSGDLYGISPKLIQCVANEMAPNLAIIVNASFRFGKFPDLLKVAKVICKGMNLPIHCPLGASAGVGRHPDEDEANH